MLKWFENIVKSSAIAGVEVLLGIDGQIKFNFCILKKNKSSIHSEKSEINITSIEALASRTILTEIPIHLAITGKTIVFKKINSSEPLNDNALLQKIFPNASLKDFYIQKTTITEGNILIAVARRTAIDELIGELKKHKLNIVSCSFGPFCAQSILPLIDENIFNAHEIVVYNHRLKLHNGIVNDFETVEDDSIQSPFLIGNDSIEQVSVVSFAAAFQYFLDEDEIIQAAIPIVTQQKEEYKQKQIFQYSSRAILALFFCIFLINFLLFSHFSRKKEELNSAVLNNKDQLLNYESLEVEVAKKEEFLQSAGLLETSRFSFYADQLAMDMPPSIQLMDLAIHPLSKKMNDAGEESISFSQKIINITGTCKKSVDVDEWIKIIEKKKWVKEVNLLNYSQKEASGEFNMEVKIN